MVSGHRGATAVESFPGFGKDSRVPDICPPLATSAKMWNIALVARGDGLWNRSAIKIQAGLGLRAMHESTGNKALITNLFACIVEDPRSTPPLPWRVAVIINSNQICSHEGLPHSLLHIMRSAVEN